MNIDISRGYQIKTDVDMFFVRGKDLIIEDGFVTMNKSIKHVRVWTDILFNPIQYKDSYCTNADEKSISISSVKEITLMPCGFVPRWTKVTETRAERIIQRYMEMAIMRSFCCSPIRWFKRKFRFKKETWK